MKGATAAAAVSILLLTACVSTYKAKPDTVAVFDIQKRVVVSSKRGGADPTVTCTEPSPDAMSALAAKLGLESTALPLGLGVGYQETAAYVGMRTESIQLLRDLAYRACEAYKNKAIDELTYGLLMRRYQKYTVVLVALERVADTYAVPAITIEGHVDISDLPKYGSVQNGLGALEARLQDLTGPYSAAAKALSEVELSKLRSTLSTVGALKSDVAQLTARAVAAASRKGHRTDLTTSILPNLGKDGPSKTKQREKPEQGSKGDQSPRSARDDLTPLVVGLADTLNTIVTADDLGEICLGVATSSSLLPLDIRSICTRYLTAKVKVFERISNDPNMSPAQAKKYLDTYSTKF